MSFVRIMYNEQRKFQFFDSSSLQESSITIFYFCKQFYFNEKYEHFDMYVVDITQFLIIHFFKSVNITYCKLYYLLYKTVDICVILVFTLVNMLMRVSVLQRSMFIYNVEVVGGDK